MTRGGGYVGLVPALAFLWSNCVTRLSLSWLQCRFLQGNPKEKKNKESKDSRWPPPLSKKGHFPPPPVTPWAWAGSLAQDPGPPGRFTKIKPVNDWPPERSRPTILPAFADPEVQGGPWGVGETSPQLPGAACPNILEIISETHY